MKKESRPDWFQEVPDNWDVGKIGWHYEIQLGKKLNQDEIEGDHLGPYLRNQDVQWWDINTEDLPEMDFYPSERKKYELKSGDILICEGGEAGRCAIWENDDLECFFQMALHRVRPRSDNHDPRFFCHFMEFAKNTGILSAGANRSTIEHLTGEKLKQQWIPVPPAPIQTKIANLLDKNRRRTEHLYSEYHRLLQHAEELIDSKTWRAVTKGVSGSKIKETDTNWIGNVPEHWDVVRTRFVTRLESGHTPSKSNDEYWKHTDIPWVTTSDIKPFRKGKKIYLQETEHNISELGLENSGAKLLPKGTVFLSRTASVGFSGIMGQEMATSQDFVNWVCDDGILAEYLLYVFRSMDQEFDRLTQGSTHQTIYMPEIKSFKTPLPPVEEQRKIVDYIQTETERIWELIDKVEEAIDLLEEKRQSLLTAVITGQINITETQSPEIETII